MKALIKQLKDNNEDFEFYPTTREMLVTVNNDIKKHFSHSYSLLDIGAGNGNVFKTLEEINPELSITKYAIEKSTILINNMDSDVFIIGTDFHQQTLIDKKVDAIFCNPPYSEFEVWVEKIITEANCAYVYMIIPDRWKNKESLMRIIERRGIEFKVIGSFDFESSEYRQARAKIDIIKFQLKQETTYRSEDKPDTDPFDIWFENFFNIKAETREDSKLSYEKENEKKEEIRNNLIKGQNLIERLEELYQKDFENLLNNYRAIEKLDPEIFRELGVNLSGVKEGLKLKISGLKNLYWHELFDNLESLTSRLTKDSRKKLLDKLTAHTSIDFTSQNVYAIVIWAIKNVNLYMDEQLKQVYHWMTYKENVINYKSNTVFMEDGWRYQKDHNHYILDYRLVFKCYKNFNDSSFGQYEYPNGLYKSTHDGINDIITIAKNLGFEVDQTTFSYEWSSGKAHSFTYKNGDKIFMEIRCYKNGNIHCKINQEFMKKFNIEAGRLNGWIKSPQEASEEMNIPIEEVIKYYNSNLQIMSNTIKLIA